MIASGSIISLGVGAAARYDQDPNSVMDTVAGALVASGLSIRSLAITGESTVSQTLGLLTFAPKNFTVKMDLQTSDDYDSSQDVLSIVTSQIYQATGFMPTQSSVTKIMSPSGVVTTTGQPDVNTPDVAAGGGSPTGGIAESVTSFLNTLTSTTKWVLIAIVGIIVLVLIVVAFSPNVPHIAKAVGGVAAL